MASVDIASIEQLAPSVRVAGSDSKYVLHRVHVVLCMPQSVKPQNGLTITIPLKFTGTEFVSVLIAADGTVTQTVPGHPPPHHLQAHTIARNIQFLLPVDQEAMQRLGTTFPYRFEFNTSDTTTTLVAKDNTAPGAPVPKDVLAIVTNEHFRLLDNMYQSAIMAASAYEELNQMVSQVLDDTARQKKRRFLLARMRHVNDTFMDMLTHDISDHQFQQTIDEYVNAQGTTVTIDDYSVMGDNIKAWRHTHGTKRPVGSPNSSDDERDGGES